MFHTRSCSIAALATIALAASSARAQWTVFNLNPANSTQSVGAGVAGNQQVGFARVGTQQASMWSGTAGSWTSLHPAAAAGAYSVAFSTSGAQQCGWAFVGGRERPSLWAGTAGSWVDLSPVGALQGRAYSVSGSQQAGMVVRPGVPVTPSLWMGTAASWVDLFPAIPAGMTRQNSEAYATNGVQQVGFVSATGSGTSLNAASLWSGSAATWVDLTPYHFERCYGGAAYGLSATQQVGAIKFVLDPAPYAVLWNGTAQSCVQLDPGSRYSSAVATDGVHQVGSARFDGIDHASLWMGSAASWVDLSLYLPGSWGHTHASSVWSDGSFIHVVGDGFNNSTGRYEALLWSRPIPGPGPASVLALGGVLAASRRARAGC